MNDTDDLSKSLSYGKFILFLGQGGRCVLGIEGINCLLGVFGNVFFIYIWGHIEILPLESSFSSLPYQVIVCVLHDKKCFFTLPTITPSIETHLALVRGFPTRSFYPIASTRRAQLSVATKVRPTDVNYWFNTD